MPFPEVIDNTMRKAMATCMTRFKNAHVLNLRPIDGTGIHLHFGAAFAKGLEMGRLVFFTRGGSAREAEDCAVNAALAYYGVADPEGTYKTPDRLEGALRHYFKTWPLEKELIVPVENGIECSFQFPLPILHPDTGKNIQYAGRYDMLGKDDRTLWVLDEKTASQLGATADMKWDLDCQIPSYLYSVKRQIATGERNLANFGQDTMDIRGMVRTISILKEKFGTMETPMVRSSWYIDRWYGQLCRDVLRAIDSYKKGTWDLALHDNACVQYGRKCDYNPLCLNPHPDRIVDGLYKEVVWNPLIRGSE